MAHSILLLWCIASTVASQAFIPAARVMRDISDTTQPAELTTTESPTDEEKATTIEETLTTFFDAEKDLRIRARKVEESRFLDSFRSEARRDEARRAARTTAEDPRIRATTEETKSTTEGVQANETESAEDTLDKSLMQNLLEFMEAEYKCRQEVTRLLTEETTRMKEILEEFDAKEETRTLAHTEEENRKFFMYLRQKEQMEDFSRAKKEAAKRADIEEYERNAQANYTSEEDREVQVAVGAWKVKMAFAEAARMEEAVLDFQEKMQEQIHASIIEEGMKWEIHQQLRAVLSDILQHQTAKRIAEKDEGNALTMSTTAVEQTAM
ncbi:hypothetical protein JTE90_017491 [Oedothorax gibbosus]|uniref:Uncharacterized protein n=1 Tax=Oedothorax gibbosus TaxID=931172 RepID=A0AAV6UAX1_9ARAC|nr:hypothetical protein JTE90_017491 [Oedothorax gibbosus]